ncbi:MAG: uracil-DNA glycosylase [Candidatus Pacebacteria bacterium]|nr:uracil-DNA glycosylase [Candidatus Paceibacterota bacterium]MBP9851151.1 uracil-DNA glycosylase [Candidatus Paceibacterota bacterium]
MSREVDIEPRWAEVLKPFFETETWGKLSDFVRDEYKNKKIYPKSTDLFKAFWLTPFDQVKVVVLGQDPYHGAGQAHGLCFSVEDGTALPPSLKNIYKEIESDLKIKKDFKNGNLESWAKQGVFLLNAILTVVASTPASHQGKGWEEFTNFVIKTISEKKKNVVFVLWGNYAKGKSALIDTTKHLVIESPHPSPFSAYSGFFGSKPFSKCNEYLKAHGEKEVDW